MIIMNIKKILISFFVLIFFSACNDNDKKPVGSGTAQVYTSVFSKQCTEGSVHIKVETVSEVSNGSSSQISTVNLDNLKVGDKVQISGTINSQVPSIGSVSFSCEGVVRIDTNRTFICNSGTLGSNLVNSPVSPNHYPGVYGTSTGSASLRMLGGQVQIHQNGTQVFTRITLTDSLNTKIPISFTCQ